MDRECLVRLYRCIAIHQDGELLSRISGLEDKAGRRDGREIRRRRRGSIDRAVVDAGTKFGRARLRYGEDISCRAAVTLIMAHVVYREARRRIVIENS